MISGLAASILSSIFMAIMVIADKLLVQDCYGNSKKSAWFVSSVAGSVLGLALTFLVWVIVGILSPAGTFWMIASTAINLFLWNGFFVLISGIFAVQLLYHYFACFSEDANITTISGWIAATPLIIFGSSITVAAISNYALGSNLLPLHTISWEFVLGVVLATAGLILFEIISKRQSATQGNYSMHLFLMIVCNVIYTILLEYALKLNIGPHTNSMYILALLPFFWIGFASGTRVLFRQSTRTIFAHQWKSTIHKYLWIILFVEIVGMLVFYFEYFGLAELQATYVSLVLGAHVIIVYIINLYIDKKTKNKSISTISKEIFFLLISILGIYIATLHMM